jgi:transposase
MARKGRRSSHEERIQAIQLLAQGYTKAQVANILQVTEVTVYSWQKDYREGGLAALSTKIASGRKSLLSDAQMLELRRWSGLSGARMMRAISSMGAWGRCQVGVNPSGRVAPT